MARIQDMAREAAKHFTQGTRGNGESFVKLAHERPDWLRDAVREAHGDMLPDDRIYALCESAVDFIADGEDGDEDGYGASEFADNSVEIWNSALLTWAASNLSRLGRSQDAYEEIGGTDADVVKILQAGQYEEARAVYAVMRDFLEAEAEAREEAEEATEAPSQAPA